MWHIVSCEHSSLIPSRLQRFGYLYSLLFFGLFLWRVENLLFEGSTFKLISRFQFKYPKHWSKNYPLKVPKSTKATKTTKSYLHKHGVIWEISKIPKKRDQGMESHFLCYVSKYVRVVYTQKLRRVFTVFKF